MRHIFTILSLFLVQNLFAQENTPRNAEIDFQQIQLDASQLFAYRIFEERVNKLIAEDKDLHSKVADYFIYHDENNLYMVLIDKSNKNKLGEFYFDKNGTLEILFDSQKQPLNEEELKHFQVNKRMLKSITKEVKERTEVRDGFWVNTILIKQDVGYKLFLFADTNLPEVIPIGNDAVFIGDENGKVISSEWFHDGLAPIKVNHDSELLRTHKHEKEQAIISPTEMAIFYFYGMLYEVKQMPILLPNEGILLGYDIEKNKIFVFYNKK